MNPERLNGGQKTVIIIGTGIALFLIGQWSLHSVEFGSSIPRGQAFYSSMTAEPTPRLMLYSWVVFVFWLLITVVWMTLSLVLLQMNGPRVE
jgi:hypothetical protein